MPMFRSNNSLRGRRAYAESIHSIEGRLRPTPKEQQDDSGKFARESDYLPVAAMLQQS